MSRDTDWQRFFAELPASDIVIKPSLGVHGFGVQLFRRQGEYWLRGDGQRSTAADIVAELRADRQYSSFVVQERVRCHRDLEALSGSDYLQTLRLVTFCSDSSGPEILFSLFRLISGDSTIDNFQGGQSGNILGDVCLEQGRILRGYAQRPAGIGLEEISHHPATGAAIADFQIPFWQESCDLVRRAATTFLPLVTIGWDIAITDEGPLLLEANPGWAPIHSVHKKMGIFRDRANALLDRRSGLDAG